MNRLKLRSSIEAFSKLQFWKSYLRFNLFKIPLVLIGIITNNGIILADYTNLLTGRGAPVRQACIEAGQSRLRPVLMTALAAILGLVPLSFFPGNSAAFIQPIGLTVIGGLIPSTSITFF